MKHQHNIISKARPLHEKIVCHQARQKGAQRGNLHGVNDRLSTFSMQYGGKIALVQRPQSHFLTTYWHTSRYTEAS